jgi:hypothetical protein
MRPTGGMWALHQYDECVYEDRREAPREDGQGKLCVIKTDRKWRKTRVKLQESKECPGYQKLSDKRKNLPLEALGRA